MKAPIDELPPRTGRHRFANVLFVPLASRGSAAALRRVAALARRDEAELTVVGVIPEPSHLQRLLHSTDHVDAVLTAAHRDMHRRLARCVGAVDGLSATPIIDVGDPALTVVMRSIAAEHDLLVVTSNGGHDDRATIRRLIRKSPCPVWVIRPSRAEHLRVLAAIDPEPHEEGLNRSILEIAESMAATVDSELHVACAWELFGEATMQSSAFVHVDADEIDRQRHQVEAAHHQATTELVHEHVVDADRVELHVRSGPASEVISDLVRHEHINLVVMGTFGRAGISGLVMGNTAEVVLDGLRCSVVAVKPPGFVSPINR
ncbi:universal stress protein [Ilumatobacter sp.]|uniref:universal stress protein n=1 Tax=Ilumatobacter sp. TaxID=1967498 RepID=UPI003AF64041